MTPLTGHLEGCRWALWRTHQQVLDRIEHEMKIIREKNFAHYFLVVADITRKAGRSCGRGSAAASIVSYALGNHPRGPHQASPLL